ncbi:MAG: thiamine pyrophosphate-dependent dehydrogenase E1 component subunit alpha [Myxococcota bacterium]
MAVADSVAPDRLPEGTFGRDVQTVLRPDGTVDEARDPGLGTEREVALYQAMVRTRLVDDRALKLQRQGRIGFHVGCLGEEACVVASAAALREQDWIFPCYREIGALLWRGFPLQAFFDNLYGNADDPARGRQMPDHYTSRRHRYASISSVVGTQIPHAVGFAWAAKIEREDLVAAVYFGDGATSSAGFHEGMNFAGVFRTPTVFLLRNNRWAISVPSERQTAARHLADKAAGYGMPGVRVDGNDPLATYAVVREAVERAAAGEGPTLVEMITYRLGGHSTSDDPRAYRLEEELAAWQEADPLRRMRARLERLGVWDDDRERAWREEVEAEIRACVERAEAKPAPPLESLVDDVYAERPPHLDGQLAELRRARPDSE